MSRTASRSTVVRAYAVLPVWKSLFDDSPQASRAPRGGTSMARRRRRNRRATTGVTLRVTLGTRFMSVLRRDDRFETTGPARRAWHGSREANGCGDHNGPPAIRRFPARAAGRALDGIP